MVDPVPMLRRAAGFARRNFHVGRPPISDPAARWSVIAPTAPADVSLVRTALLAAERAQDLDLNDVAARAKRPDESRWVRQWPGEHYRLLAALVETLEVRSVVEIGTFTGLSALSMLTSLPIDGKLSTFDIVPWDAVEGSALRPDDFGQRLVQHLGDLSDPHTFAAHRRLLSEADLIFIDGPKDRRFERALLDRLLPTLAASDTATTLVIDDIRVLEMVDVWERIDAPKLDITSLGHWSGTGLVRLA